MAVKIRMTRVGRRHRPFFRINAVDGRTPRNGKILEKLGHYDPIIKNPDEQLVLDLERVKYWLDKGAIPSDTVSEILLKQGIKTKYQIQKEARRAKARAQARKAGKFFTKAEKIEAEKKAEQERIAAEEKAKAEEEARKKAEEEAKKKAEEEAKAKAEAEEKAAAEESESEEKSEE